MIFLWIWPWNKRKSHGKRGKCLLELSSLGAMTMRQSAQIDASAHAELLALRQGARNLKNWRYPPNCTLYTTLEPCPMCLSSIQAFRIDNLVYGAPDHRLGAVETHMNLLSIVKHPYHEIKSVVGGVQEEKCGGIVVDFFRERRKIKKESKSLTLHDEG
eukprot:CCRYP_000754-RA/>CCRYP_000754-RA protein AED:0.03 eAED:0.03 QI:557/1/1/1/0/0/2/462/158